MSVYLCISCTGYVHALPTRDRCLIKSMGRRIYYAHVPTLVAE